MTEQNNEEGVLEPVQQNGGSGCTVTAKRKGRCKWFNVAKGWGFITPVDSGQDVFVHQSVIQMAGFRSLGDDELVEFECQESDKGLEATFVTGPDGVDCKGSHRRPVTKKRFRKIRCYNCGEFANHIAAKCNMGPQPKRCHHCKAEDHLIAECPLRPPKRRDRSEEISTPVSPNMVQRVFPDNLVMPVARRSKNGQEQPDGITCRSGSQHTISAAGMESKGEV